MDLIFRPIIETARPVLKSLAAAVDDDPLDVPEDQLLTAEVVARVTKSLDDDAAMGEVSDSASMVDVDIYVADGALHVRTDTPVIALSPEALEWILNAGAALLVTAVIDQRTKEI